MNNARPLIGICGKKQTGKDTVAKMIAYIIRKGVTQASYNEWAKLFDNEETKDICIFHFADKVKDICSDLFGIDRDKFDIEKYKDEMYFDFDRKEFVNPYDINNNSKYKYKQIISIDDLKKEDINSYIRKNNNKILFTLRTLMQYVGTEIGRNKLFDKVWISYCLNKAEDYRNTYGFAIVADVRFENEAKAIQENYRGFVIKLTRNNNMNDSHISENGVNIDTDYVIDNTGITKFTLFYKVREIVKDVLNVDNINNGRM